VIKGFGSLAILFVVTLALLAAVSVYILQKREVTNRLDEIGQASELKEEEFEEFFEDQINEIGEKISTSSASIDEIKESTSGANLPLIYTDDMFNFTLSHPKMWGFVPWDWGDPGKFVSRLISIQINGKFVGQLGITPGASIHVAKSTWLRSDESETTQIGEYKVDGILASKLHTDHVVHDDAFVYLWEYDGAVYNLFILASAEKTIENILDSFSYNK